MCQQHFLFCKIHFYSPIRQWIRHWRITLVLLHIINVDIHAVIISSMSISMLSSLFLLLSSALLRSASVSISNDLSLSLPRSFSLLSRLSCLSSSDCLASFSFSSCSLGKGWLFPGRYGIMEIIQS